MAERIQRKRTKGWRLPGGVLIVSRPSRRWDNPFAIALFGRDLAVALFRESAQGCWLPQKTAHLPKHLQKIAYQAHVEMQRRFENMTVAEAARVYLPGVSVACWCPLPNPGEADLCHGRALVEFAAGKSGLNANDNQWKTRRKYVSD